MTIRFGIIGCGHIANRHAQHILNHPQAELRAAFDIKTDVLRSFSGRHGCTAESSLDSLLSDPKIDIVTICTPNGNHCTSAVAALKARKHVLIEKPMALCKADCEEIVNHSFNSDRKVFVVKQNRYNPPIQALKKRIDEGKLGKVHFVTVNCFWNRNAQYYLNSDWKGSKDLDGGTLFTQFSHFVDILYYLFGDIIDIQGKVRNVNHQGLIEFEDTGSFIFSFKNGPLGNLNYTTSAYRQNMEGSLTLFAEQGTIKVGGKYLNQIDYQATLDCDIVDLPPSQPANQYGSYEGSMSNHDKVIDNVVRTLKGEENIMTNSLEGMKVVDIIERMYASAGVTLNSPTSVTSPQFMEVSR